MKEKNVDGLIHITAFGCGPILLGKLAELDSDIYESLYDNKSG